jgi:hypothetical protein
MYTLAEVRAGVARLEQAASDFFNGPDHVVSGAWVKGKGGVFPRVELGEVWWEHGKSPFRHPSRNPFHLVTDGSQKKLWHQLATGGLMVTNVREGPLPKKVAERKPLDIPDWALDSSNVIGYTAPSKIMASDLNNLMGVALRLGAVPSVYFKKGHATIDHIMPGNVGWEAPSGRCIFFGNIPHGLLKQVFP